MTRLLRAKGDDQAEALSWQDVDHFFHGAGQVIQSITPVVQAAAPHFKGKRELTDAIYSRLARECVLEIFHQRMLLICHLLTAFMMISSQ